MRRVLMKAIEQAANEAGYSIIEVLMAIGLLGIVSVGIATNTINAVTVAKKTEINYYASNLALSKVEELASREPDELDSSMGGTETGLSLSGTNITFSRQTTITANSDGSKSISVYVETEDSPISTHTTFESTFAPWE